MDSGLGISISVTVSSNVSFLQPNRQTEHAKRKQINWRENLIIITYLLFVCKKCDQGSLVFSKAVNL
jgi:hypothetical protein